MGTIKDEALNEADKSKVKNISELNSVDTDFAVLKEENSQWPYKFIEINSERYKIPKSVLDNLKVILKDNQTLKNSRF